MSAKNSYYVGNDPHGYGGLEEVSVEQAHAYAEAIAKAAKEAFPDADIHVGFPPDMYVYVPAADQLPLHGWVQANWRRIRAEVNTARGWQEQWGGALWADTNRC